MTNCVNCGAPVDKLLVGPCPYCGTYNIDMTMIDLDRRTPVGIAVKSNGFVFKTMAIPEMGSISFTSESVDCRGRHGERLYSMSSS